MTRRTFEEMLADARAEAESRSLPYSSASYWCHLAGWLEGELKVALADRDDLARRLGEGPEDDGGFDLTRLEFLLPAIEGEEGGRP